MYAYDSSFCDETYAAGRWEYQQCCCSLLRQLVVITNCLGRQLFIAIWQTFSSVLTNDPFSFLIQDFSLIFSPFVDAHYCPSMETLFPLGSENHPHFEILRPHFIPRIPKSVEGTVSFISPPLLFLSKRLGDAKSGET